MYGILVIGTLDNLCIQLFDGRSFILVLISYFSASGNALLSGPNILPGGRTDSRTDVRSATCNI